MVESITRKARQFEPANWLASIFLILLRRSDSLCRTLKFPIFNVIYYFFKVFFNINLFLLQYYQQNLVSLS